MPDHPVAVNRARRGLDHEEVKDNMEAGSNWKPYPVGFDSNSYLIRPAKSFQTVKEGFVFDLGNIKLEVLEMGADSLYCNYCMLIEDYERAGEYILKIRYCLRETHSIPLPCTLTSNILTGQIQALKHIVRPCTE